MEETWGCESKQEIFILRSLDRVFTSTVSSEIREAPAILLAWVGEPGTKITTKSLPRQCCHFTPIQPTTFFLAQHKLDKAIILREDSVQDSRYCRVRHIKRYKTPHRTMASKSGNFLTEGERKRLIRSLESSGELKRTTSSGDFSSNVPSLAGNDTGMSENKSWHLPFYDDFHLRFRLISIQKMFFINAFLLIGCLVCGHDDDHNNLMLCEECNDEYHTYCLDPPLSAVPHDDWYCGECSCSFFGDKN